MLGLLPFSLYEGGQKLQLLSLLYLKDVILLLPHLRAPGARSSCSLLALGWCSAGLRGQPNIPNIRKSGLKSRGTNLLLPKHFLLFSAARTN